MPVDVATRSGRGMLAAGTAAMLAAASLPAQDLAPRTITDPLPAGRIIERLTSRADTSQRYALYLPAAYGRDRAWPVLFLLDPRGRALLPLRLFQQGAERHGYIAVSSYNTLSDGPAEPNYQAMHAMLEDVQRALAVDSRRFYLVGFSGTARFAWEFSPQLVGSVAGIVGFGAAVPGGRAWIRSNVGRGAPVFFGGAGTLDPNYEELRALDAELDSVGLQHHVTRFDGPHAWPPAETASRAVAWLELQAMRRGLRARDQRWIDSLHADRLAEAKTLDERGDAPVAYRAYQALAADFDGLTDTGAAASRAAALAGHAGVRRSLATEAALAGRDRQYGERLVAFLSDARSSTRPLSMAEARRRIGLDELLGVAADARDSAASIAARRALERIFTHTSFYAPRAFLAQRRWDHAAAMLRVARAIHPDDAGACLGLAQALAQTGAIAEALEALGCAARSERVTAAAVEGDSLLLPLGASERYRSILDDLKARGAGAPPRPDS